MKKIENEINKLLKDVVVNTNKRLDTFKGLLDLQYKMNKLLFEHISDLESRLFFLQFTNIMFFIIILLLLFVV